MWRNRLHAIQEANLEKDGVSDVSGGLSRGKCSIGRPNRIANGKANIPGVRTLHAAEVGRTAWELLELLLMLLQYSVTIEELDTWDDLINNLESIEPPSQIASVLQDPALRRYLTLSRTEHALSRLNFWLVRCYDEVLEDLKDGNGSSAFISETLSAALDYTRYMKRMPHEIRDFVGSFVSHWDGVTDAWTVLQLLAQLPLHAAYNGRRRPTCSPGKSTDVTQTHIAMSCNSPRRWSVPITLNAFNCCQAFMQTCLET